jgi:hypothetical protein
MRPLIKIIDSLDNINGFSAGVGVDIGIGSVQGGNISVGSGAAGVSAGGHLSGGAGFSIHNPKSKTNTHCSRNTTSATTIIVTPFIKTTTSNQCMPSYFYTRTSIKTTYVSAGGHLSGGAGFSIGVDVCWTFGCKP